MKKIIGFAGAIALSIIATPSFSGEVEQKEMMSVTEQLLPQIGEKYKNLDIKEKKTYKEALINYLEDVQKTGATGVGEKWSSCDEFCMGSSCCSFESFEGGTVGQKPELVDWDFDFSEQIIDLR